MTCSKCGEEVCRHGNCWCEYDHGCPECFRRRELEREADREAAWQRDVIGPLLGFEDE